MVDKTEQDVASAVLAVIQDITGTVVSRIRRTDSLLDDLEIDGDDFSFVFVRNVEEKLGIKTNPVAWRHVRTVQQAIDVFLSATSG